ncbi:MFS transporter [Streptomyces sp. NPDC001941]|uniref:MFS transporter n=1 Tax=Streptomyces sp. NPDC001941 TaxID=3154659 RepID=UPI00331CE8BF
MSVPLFPLLALSTAAFVTLLTEGLPAGVLPEMAHDLSVSPSAMGQSLTVYALATGLSAIPLSRATATWRRRRLLLTAVAVFAVANTVTALSPSYALTLGSRVLAGVAAAAVWAELVGYARRLAPAHLQGRAIAIVLAGIPLAMSLGIPLGSFLGRLVGWRPTFVLVTLVALALLGWIRAAVPDAPGHSPARASGVRSALRLPGVAAVLIATACYVLAHNILYTYIAAFLDDRGAGGSRQAVLLVFGIASTASVAVTGALVDRRPRALMLAGTLSFIAGGALLTTPHGGSAALYAAAVLWGLGWGGAATLLQTAVNDAAGTRGQTLFVTVCNTAIAGGGALGGLLLTHLGAGSLPWAVLALLLPALATVAIGRAHAFPRTRLRRPEDAGGRAG